MATDWNAVKTEYITTSISQRKLAKKFGISLRNLNERSSREGWVEQQSKYREKTVTKAISKASDKEANHLSALMISADKMAENIREALEDKDQFYRYALQKREKYAEPVSRIVTDGDGNSNEVIIEEQQWIEEQVLEKLDTKALKDLTGALKDLTTTMRNLYGLPSQAEAEAQRIAAERLLLDQRKAQAGDGDAAEIKVSFYCPEGAGDEGSEAWRK